MDMLPIICLAVLSLGDFSVDLPGNPNESQQLAARELTASLERATGAKRVPGGKLRFVLGSGPEGSDSDVPPLSSLAERRGNSIYLWGDDSGEYPGTLYAVYGFLAKRMGVVWAYPGEDGVFVPKRNGLEFPEGERDVSEPRYALGVFRAMHASGMTDFQREIPPALQWSEAKAKTRVDEIEAWHRRHRLYSREKFTYGHAFTDWQRRFEKTHPEYLSLREDGTRVGLKRQNPSTTKLCVSNPDVAKQIIADWKAAGAPKYLNVCENDGFNYCVCKGCKALDTDLPGEDFNLNKTDRYLWFWNRLAKLARMERPDVQLVAYIYSSYRFPPRRERVEYPENMCFGVVPTFTDDIRAFLDGWEKVGMKQFFLRPNFHCSYAVLPRGVEKYIYDVYAYCRQRGMMGVDFDSDFGRYPLRPENYVTCRMIAEPEGSFEKFMDEFCSAFGEAKEDVSAYYGGIRRRYETRRGQVNAEARRGVMLDDSEMARFQTRFHTEAELLADVAHLERAAARTFADAAAKKRVNDLVVFARHYVLTWRFLDAAGAKDKSRLALAARQLVDFRISHRDVLKDFYGMNMAGNWRGLENRIWKTLSLAPSDDGMFPFVIRPDAMDTVVDMSGLLPRPAGRNGFVRCDGEHFVDGSGGIVRLNGVNLTARANFPTHDEADRLAKHFARLGFNCVRLHYFDVLGYANNFQDFQPCLYKTDASGKMSVVDEAMRDRLDYLIAALKREGIFIDMNLHVGRELGPNDGIRKTCWANRGVDYFVRNLVDAEKEYARDVLSRVNPYTGLALADDPAMAVVEINNENALMQVYWSGTLQKQGADPWYLEEFDRLREAEGYDATTNGVNRFIVEAEKRYFREMVAHLKEGLGVKCPVIGTQLGYTAAWVTADTCDASDIHIYWTHPKWTNRLGTDGRQGRCPEVEWNFLNKSIVAAGLDGGWNMENVIAGRGSRRIKGLPFIVSECAAPYPNWYGAEFQPMIHAYAAFQDWAGVFVYSWNNDAIAFPDSSPYFFSHAARPDCVAHFPAACAMFLGGGVAKARRRIDVSVDVGSRFPRAGNAYTALAVIDPESASDGRVPNAVFLRHGVAVDLKQHVVPPASSVACGTNGVMRSDTEEIVLRRAEGKEGWFSVDAPNVKFLSGFISGRRFDLGGVVLEPGETKLGWCAVSLVAQDGRAFGAGSRLLLAVTGYTHNEGDRIHCIDGDKWGGTVADVGTGKVITEGVPLKLTLSAEGAECWALDEAGGRRQSVPVAVQNGRATIAVGPDFRTIWYEIQL